MRLGDAFRLAVREKVGHAQKAAQPDRDPEWSDVEERFPTSASLAEHLGYGRAGEHARGTDAYRRRAAFLGQYRRWRARGRIPSGEVWGKRLRSIVRSQWRKASIPRTERQVLEQMARYGITVSDLSLTVKISEESYRARVFDQSVAITAGQLAAYTFPETFAGRILWRPAAVAVVNAWADSYGMPVPSNLRDVDTFDFSIGVDPDADFALGDWWAA